MLFFSETRTVIFVTPGRKKRVVTREQQEEENERYIKPPFIDTWKQYQPIKKGETVNYRKRHRKKIGE